MIRVLKDLTWAPLVTGDGEGGLPGVREMWGQTYLGKNILGEIRMGNDTLSRALGVSKGWSPGEGVLPHVGGGPWSGCGGNSAHLRGTLW